MAGRLLVLMLLALVLTNAITSPVRAFADDSPLNPASFITRAVFANGRLWVLSEDGRLSSIAETEKTWTRNIPGRVIDLWKQRRVNAGDGIAFCRGPWCGWGGGRPYGQVRLCDQLRLFRERCLSLYNQRRYRGAHAGDGIALCGGRLRSRWRGSRS